MRAAGVSPTTLKSLELLECAKKVISQRMQKEGLGSDDVEDGKGVDSKS